MRNRIGRNAVAGMNKWGGCFAWPLRLLCLPLLTLPLLTLPFRPQGLLLSSIRPADANNLRIIDETNDWHCIAASIYARPHQASRSIRVSDGAPGRFGDARAEWAERAAFTFGSFSHADVGSRLFAAIGRGSQARGGNDRCWTRRGANTGSGVVKPVRREGHGNRSHEGWQRRGLVCVCSMIGYSLEAWLAACTSHPQPEAH